MLSVCFDDKDIMLCDWWKGLDTTQFDKSRERIWTCFNTFHLLFLEPKNELLYFH